jgi:hypothetical protein
MLMLLLNRIRRQTSTLDAQDQARVARIAARLEARHAAYGRYHGAKLSPAERDQQIDVIHRWEREQAPEDVETLLSLIPR